MPRLSDAQFAETLRERNKKALAARESTLEDVRSVIIALGSPADVHFDDTGALVLDTGRGGDPYRLNSDSLLAYGTIFQSPGHAALNTAIAARTEEARLVRFLEGALPPHFGRDLARVLAASLLRGFWGAGNDEKLLMGAAGRKIPVTLRPKLSRALYLGSAQGGLEGVTRVRQYCDLAPVALRLLSAQEIADRAVAGESPWAALEPLGAGKVVRELAPAALPLVSLQNVGTFCQILANARDADAIPNKPRHREWLRPIHAIAALPEPAGGFCAWMARQSATRANLREADWRVIHLWATLTAGERGGWHARISLPKALARSVEWQEAESVAQAGHMARIERLEAEYSTLTHAEALIRMGPEKVDQLLEHWSREEETFSTDYPAFFGDTLAIKPITTRAGLRAAGLALDNCLGELAEHWATRAMTGKFAIFTVHRVTSHKDAAGTITRSFGAMIGSIEVARTGYGAAVVQNFGKSNRAPSAQQTDLVTEYLATLPANLTHTGTTS